MSASRKGRNQARSGEPHLSEAERCYEAPPFPDGDMVITLDSELRDMLACPICKESYDDPKRRPRIVQIRVCGHRLCEDCYDSLFSGRFSESSLALHGKPVPICCPECKRKLGNPKKDKIIDEDTSRFMRLLQEKYKMSQQGK